MSIGFRISQPYVLRIQAFSKGLQGFERSSCDVPFLNLEALSQHEVYSWSLSDQFMQAFSSCDEINSLEPLLAHCFVFLDCFCSHDCGKRSVRQAYHTLCTACSKQRNVCAKCCHPATTIIGRCVSTFFLVSLKTRLFLPQ
jgi:hypothetical protein